MGTQFSRGLPKGGETVQVVRQVFQADFDFRAAAAFWRIPVQTFQLFSKDLPRDQHLQNILPAPGFFRRSSLISTKNKRICDILYLFFTYTRKPFP